VLIKVVAQTIPTYIISLFKLPKELCHTIQSSIIRFLWRHKQKNRKTHWIKASHFCTSEDDGGLGFLDSDLFNDALLAKQIWTIIKGDGSLVARLLRGKYYLDGTFLMHLLDIAQALCVAV